MIRRVVFLLIMFLAPVVFFAGDRYDPDAPIREALRWGDVPEKIIDSLLDMPRSVDIEPAGDTTLRVFPGRIFWISDNLKYSGIITILDTAVCFPVTMETIHDLRPKDSDD